MSVTCALVSALVGLVLSPFLHRLIHRTPRHLALRLGAHCPRCGVTTARSQRYTWIALARRSRTCRTCGLDLFADSPKLELAAAALFFVVGARIGWQPELVAYWLFFFAALTIVVVDLRHYLIPTRVVYPTVLAGIVLLAIAALIGGAGPLWAALIAMVGCWLFYFVVFIGFPAGMGFGDVRLSLMVGLFTGWFGVSNAVMALLLGLVSGAATGVFLVLVRLRSRKDAIPFAPFMLLGAAITILFGTALPSLLA